MCVEIADGKVLHPVEHLLAHLGEEALRNDRKELCMDGAEDERDDVHPDEGEHIARDDAADFRPRLPCRLRLFDDGVNILHEDGGHGAHDGVDDEEDDGERRHAGVVAEERLHHAGEGPLLLFGFYLRRFGGMGAHFCMQFSFHCLPPLPESDKLPHRWDWS